MALRKVQYVVWNANVRRVNCNKKKRDKQNFKCITINTDCEKFQRNCQSRMGNPVFRDRSEWTAVPFDPRFPNTNQTKNCYQNYIDFHRCKNKRGEEFSACQYFKKVYKELCPSVWVNKWDEQIEAGVFPGKI